MTLATLGYGINDVVRGAVKCDGEDGMLQDLETMKSNPTLGPIRFRTKRIKNTHHEDASTVGGYRDVKVIGELTIGESDSMLVEVQLIDRVFLDIKKFMHRPYSVGRGDFGSMPLLGRVCQGSKEVLSFESSCKKAFQSNFKGGVFQFLYFTNWCAVCVRDK